MQLTESARAGDYDVNTGQSLKPAASESTSAIRKQATGNASDTTLRKQATNPHSEETLLQKQSRLSQNLKPLEVLLGVKIP